MRVITQNNYPPNIAVFHAATIGEAISIADRAFKKDTIQGAVWLKHDFDQTAYAPEKLLNTTEIDGEEGIYSASARLTGRRRVEFDFDHCSFADTHLTRDVLSQNLTEVRGIKAPRSSLRFAIREPVIPHIDGHAHAGWCLPWRFFENKPVRIIQNLYGAGTLVYDPHEATKGALDNVCNQSNIHHANFLTSVTPIPGLGLPWQVASGDRVFLLPEIWGRDKALIHSAPRTNVSSFRNARVTRVIDLFPR
ncbi:MAG: hypothetical protein HRT94_02150 [Alphaproteobacteria bacterium]|nr:hypothetical protein [Alphaproteobacteria bacterium]